MSKINLFSQNIREVKNIKAQVGYYSCCTCTCKCIGSDDGKMTVGEITNYEVDNSVSALNYLKRK